MKQIDYYKILGIDKTADRHSIRDAYRKRAFQYHPDRNSDDPEAAEKMKTVNEAYAVLSDESKRSRYDAMQDQYGDKAYDWFRSSYSEHDIFTGSDFSRVFEELAKDFGFRGFDDVFKEAYGQGFATFKFKKPGMFAKGFVFTSGSGKSGKGTSPKKVSGGSPDLIESVIRKLTGLGGDRQGSNLEDTILLTPELAEAGGPYAYYHKKNDKKLLVKIPPGIKPGQKIRLAGMGNTGRGEGPSGDLYLKVRVRGGLIAAVKQVVQDVKTKFL